MAMGKRKKELRQEELWIAQIVEGQERVVVPAPITVNVTDVAFAPLAISSVANDQPRRVPLLEGGAGGGEKIMEGLSPRA